ncbi:hypothetical protein AMELA_G00057500 [Ameiurus melas]|uniref:Uncharacterized protein n=1 Tax=Ameiurus melas TaxID=219545 RepID=A0A7J6B2L5_AMEME|nr:hypothetical protein AMELA_G00057500 [Ameiurus melas]
MQSGAEEYSCHEKGGRDSSCCLGDGRERSAPETTLRLSAILALSPRLKPELWSGRQRERSYRFSCSAFPLSARTERPVIPERSVTHHEDV